MACWEEHGRALDHPNLTLENSLAHRLVNADVDEGNIYIYVYIYIIIYLRNEGLQLMTASEN